MLVTSGGLGVANAADPSPVAATYAVIGEAPVTGDVISFDAVTGAYARSVLVGDAGTVGVVNRDAFVVARTLSDGVPVITSGETVVNVTTINGPISVGDYLTTSTVPGKAERSTRDTDTVVGVALEAFPPVGTDLSSLAPDAAYSGAVRALVKVGPRPALARGVGDVVGGSPARSVTGLSTPVATLIKYVLAALVVIGSIYIAFKNFGRNLRDSIVSVGRNPLAKPAIQSMVVINTVLVIVVSAAGLFLGLMILFVQL